MNPNISVRQVDMLKNLRDLRREYIKGELAEEVIPENPVDFFKEWFEEAGKAEVNEPNAMALATVTPEGKPEVRTVLLKGIENDSIQFFTNYKSDKALELEEKPYVSCCFWWAELERQVRVSGPVKKLDESENIAYFKTRPRESQIGAWASNQSSEIPNRERLISDFEKFKKKFEGQDVPKPAEWGGYSIEIQKIEFWQGRPGRLHDRISCIRQNGKWKKRRLAP